MRPDRLRLLDIVEAAGRIVLHIGERNEEALVADQTARAAVLHELTVIGEAAARISEETRTRCSEIPWNEIIAFRNVVIHEYNHPRVLRDLMADHLDYRYPRRSRSLRESHREAEHGVR